MKKHCPLARQARAVVVCAAVLVENPAVAEQDGSESRPLVEVAGTCRHGAGPRLSAEDFFNRHVDTSIPGLSGIPERMAAGDLSGAEAIFARHVRSSLRPEAVNRQWLTRKYSPEEMAKLKRAVEKTLDYRFSVAKAGEHHFENHRIDWTINPTFNNYKEWTWQFNRMGFWRTLAEYYTQTRDERIVACWIDQIKSWFDQALAPEDNNPYRPCTWRTIEAGLRMCGWAHQLHAFVRSPLVTDEFLTRYFRSIWEHGHRLETATHGRGNWVVIEKTGLLHVAMLYPYFRESEHWRELAVSCLLRELDRQVYPDGFQVELSTEYQGVLAHYYGQAVLLYQILDIPVPEPLMSRFTRLWDVYPRLMMPDGRTPNLNDGEWCDVARKMRAALEYMPERSDWQWFATGGTNGVPPCYTSYVFPWAGAVTMRNGWDRSALWAYMDASPFGMGHQHEDKLNVLVQAYGKDMLTEGGRYFYDESEMRKYVRSTRSHNTVRVDGKDQAARATYRWSDDDVYRMADVRFGLSPKVDWAEASYVDGYKSPGAGLEDLDRTIHTRKLIFFKSVPGVSPFFAVIDRLTAPDERRRTYETMWHIESSKLSVVGRRFVAEFGDGVSLSAASSDADSAFVNMEGQKEPYLQGWMPVWKSGPHEHRAIPTPVSVGAFSGARRIVTILHPIEAGLLPIISVEASTDVKAVDFEVTIVDGTRVCLHEDALE